MKKPISLTASAILAVLIILAGCNLPSRAVAPTMTEAPNAVYTHAAETVAAELTRVASLVTPTPTVPSPTPTFYTPTSTPTSTPTYTPSYTPIPCNLATYDPSTIDVTVPDYTLMNPGQTFTKIWRLRNSGSCTWTTAYKVTFDSDSGMGVTPGYSQPLPGVVPPNQTVDIAVNLTAPAANGTYTGKWSLRTPDNQVMLRFVVIIKVAAPTTVTLIPVAAESGAVRSDGQVFLGSANYIVGDSTTNKAIQLFLSYDISGIPANATINEVKIKFNNYIKGGDPFGDLGILNGYLVDYGTAPDAADFVSGFPSGNVVDWGSTAALDVEEISAEMKNALKSRLGHIRLQLRLQFPSANTDGGADYIQFADPSLVVTYIAP